MTRLLGRLFSALLDSLPAGYLQLCYLRHQILCLGRITIGKFPNAFGGALEGV